MFLIPLQVKLQSISPTMSLNRFLSPNRGGLRTVLAIPLQDLKFKKRGSSDTAPRVKV